jgi:hypothetical protein
MKTSTPPDALQTLTRSTRATYLVPRDARPGPPRQPVERSGHSAR